MDIKIFAYKCPIVPALFFFFNFIYLFIYLFICFWLCWVFVSVRGLSLVAASTGLSLSQPLLLRSASSRRAGSVVVAHGPSCSASTFFVGFFFVVVFKETLFSNHLFSIFCLRVCGRTASVCSCCKEFENIFLVHVQDLKGSGYCGSFPLSYHGNQNTAVLTPPWVPWKVSTFVEMWQK